MMKWILSSVVVSLLSISLSIACDEEGKTGIAPENDLYISSNVKSANGITEEVFHDVIDEVMEVYDPIIRKLGKTPVVNRLWDNGTVNASAQQSGKRFIINMYGGLARHHLVTRDGFAIVVCHELGHHLAGAPKVRRFFFPTWASNEGQSDYFATFKCFKKVYGQDDNIEFISKLKIDPIVKDQCEQVYPSAADSALCIRASYAAKSTANLLASLRGKKLPKFGTPDKSEVRKTDHSHPAAQCRLDTYFQGALCDLPLEGELSDEDANIGTCNRENNDQVGIRPLCWYSPKVGWF